MRYSGYWSGILWERRRHDFWRAGRSKGSMHVESDDFLRRTLKEVVEEEEKGGVERIIKSAERRTCE